MSNRRALTVGPVRLSLMTMRRPYLFLALTCFVAACSTTNLFNSTTIIGGDGGGADSSTKPDASQGKDASTDTTLAKDVAQLPDTSTIADSSVPDTSDAADAFVDTSHCSFGVPKYYCDSGTEFRVLLDGGMIDEPCGSYTVYACPPDAVNCYTKNFVGGKCEL